MLTVNEIEFLATQRKLDDPAQLTLVRWRFLIAHIHLHTLLAQGLIYNAAVFVDADIAFPANHVLMVLLQCPQYQRTRDGLIVRVKHYILDVHVLTVNIGHRHALPIATAPCSIHNGQNPV